ncbi:unnamed protein product [Mortierella alpina]
MPPDVLASSSDRCLPPAQQFLVLGTDEGYQGTVKLDAQRDSLGFMVVYWSDIMHVVENAIYLRDDKGMVATFLRDPFTNETRVPLRVLYSRNPMTIIVHKPHHPGQVVLPLSKGLRIEPERTLSASTRIRRSLYRALFRAKSAPTGLQSTASLDQLSFLEPANPTRLTTTVKHEVADVGTLPTAELSRQTALAINSADASFTIPSASGWHTRLPESAIQSLIAALKGDDISVRYSAYLALDGQPALSESAILSLIDALEHEHGDVRDSATAVLGTQRQLSKSAIQTLITTLGYGNRDARASAASVWICQPTLPRPVIEPLIAALRDEGVYVRASASCALIKQSVLPESTIAALKDEQEAVRTSAASESHRQPMLSDSTIQLFVAALRDEREAVRISAAAELRKYQDLSEATVQSLIAALRDETMDVRLLAASAIRKQTTLSQSAVHSVVAILKCMDNNARSAAVSALDRPSELPERAIRALFDVLKDEEDPVRDIAKLVLTAQSKLPESSIQSPITAFKDESEDSRRPAPVAPVAVRRQSSLSYSALPPMQSIVSPFRSKGEGARAQGPPAWGKQGMLSESPIQSPFPASRDTSESFKRSAAAPVAQKRKTPSPHSNLPSSQSIVAPQKYRHEGAKASAPSAIGKPSMLSESAVKSLIAEFKDENVRVRCSAALTLGWQSWIPESVVQPLLEALQDRDWRVRGAAAVAVSKHSLLRDPANKSLLVAQR